MLFLFSLTAQSNCTYADLVGHVYDKACVDRCNEVANKWYLWVPPINEIEVLVLVSIISAQFIDKCMYL